MSAAPGRPLRKRPIWPWLLAVPVALALFAAIAGWVALRASLPALGSIMPNVGPYPYPMLEYGSPALPEFYSRGLLFGNVEEKIINHRRIFPYAYHRERPAANRPAEPLPA